jgi:hypothetical protein
MEWNNERKKKYARCWEGGTKEMREKIKRK